MCNITKEEQLDADIDFPNIEADPNILNFLTNSNMSLGIKTGLSAYTTNKNFARKICKKLFEQIWT